MIHTGREKLRAFGVLCVRKSTLTLLLLLLLPCRSAMSCRHGVGGRRRTLAEAKLELVARKQTLSQHSFCHHPWYVADEVGADLGGE